MFHDPALEVILCHLHKTLLVTQVHFIRIEQGLKIRRDRASPRRGFKPQRSQRSEREPREVRALEGTALPQTVALPCTELRSGFKSSA